VREDGPPHRARRRDVPGQDAGNRPVPDPVPPVDQLSRLNTEREPVPGLCGDLLPEDHQKIITGVRMPRAVRVSRVVFRGRDEIQACGPRTGGELLRRQLAVRVHRMHMTVTPVPATPPGGYSRRRELQFLHSLRPFDSQGPAAWLSPAGLLRRMDFLR